MPTIVWAALAAIIGQGAIVFAVLKLARSFGAYTNVILQTHQQNMLIQQELFNQADDLARLRAQLFTEHRAQRPQQPLHSEDAVA